MCVTSSIADVGFNVRLFINNWLSLERPVGAPHSSTLFNPLVLRVRLLMSEVHVPGRTRQSPTVGPYDLPRASQGGYSPHGHLIDIKSRYVPSVTTT